MAAAISPAAVSAFTLRKTVSELVVFRATGAMTGMKPLSKVEIIADVLTSETLPTYPNSGLRIVPFNIPPSAPESPIAFPPIEVSAVTICLLIKPVSTLTTISRLGLSVTRRPRTKRGRTPCFSIHSVISLPPPWTTTAGLPFCCRVTRS